MRFIKASRICAVVVCFVVICFEQSSARVITDSAFEPETAASSDHHYGRVHIKVFRGPSQDHHFAPHGYWIKQPADDGHHR